MAALKLTSELVGLRVVVIPLALKTSPTSLSCFTGDLQEETAMGTDGTRSRLSGLKDWSLEMTMKQDFVTGQICAVWLGGWE